MGLHLVVTNLGVLAFLFAVHKHFAPADVIAWMKIVNLMLTQKNLKRHAAREIRWRRRRS